MKHLNIAVGVIRNSQQEIFITRRGENSHLAGCWEFPGGKIEQGEMPEQALCRELGEEVGVTPCQTQLIEVLEHHFPDRIVTLHFYLVESWAGEPYGREGQPTHWVKQVELDEEAFPVSNAKIIRLLIGQTNSSS